MKDNNLNVYCIPGLGMNALLFNNLVLPDCNIIPVTWLSPIKNETLPEYAMRLSMQIDSSKPFILLGVSFGGMCAIEISKKLHPLKTILISSSKASKELPGAFKIFKYIPLHLIFSDSLYLKLVMFFQKRLGVSMVLKEEFKKMLALPPENYYSRSIEMILHWKNETIPANVVHIHGTGDQVLFYNKNVHYDHIIEEGAHFMIVNRANEINAIITNELSSLL